MRVIIRTKKNRDYFYLQHSFRKGGKVITKELYIGRKIPNNIDEIKSKILLEAREDLTRKLEKIRSHFQKEWKRYPESAKERELHEIALSFTYNTNAIEGSTITLEEARIILEDKVAPNKSIREIWETESHAAVFLEMLRTTGILSAELLLKWHKDIFKETKPDIAGRFRDYLVRVGPFVAPDWRKIPDLMKQLIEFVNESRINPVELAARAHYMFEKTHPFGDGNGRIGRLLMNYILWNNGYPMLIIEYKRRKAYYRALEKTEEKFVNYFIRRYLSVNEKHWQ